ncbi:MAG: hypothetical protein ACO1OT_02505 [Heyndrickxia sp.]
MKRDVLKHIKKTFQIVLVMKLYFDLEEGCTDDTMSYVHANRNLVPTPRVPLTYYYIYQRGKYILVEYNLQVHYWEHIGHGCYLEEALYYMEPDKPASWKTLDRLVIFRQA